MTAQLEDGFADESGGAGARPRGNGLPRLLPASGHDAWTAPNLTAHLAEHGPVPYRGGPRLLISTIAEAGLTGRGGAAFPTHRKWLAVVDGRARPVVVGNASEGEPASAKDKTLLMASPHLVLDGLQLAAEAVGAREAYLYLHRDPRLRSVVDHALRERRRARVDRARVEVVEAPVRFLSGEESALVNRVAGGDAVPRGVPPRVFEKGVRGRPTLVQNVETLAQVALLARYGVGWWRAVGTPDEPGSMLLTVRAGYEPPRVVEAAIGTPVRDVLASATREPLAVRAVLFGGYHGAWLTDAAAGGSVLDLPLTNAALRPRGAALGAGVLVALPEGTCGLVETARVVRYLAEESAGQCGPCLNGLPAIAEAFTELAGPRPRPQTERLLQRWSSMVERRGACHHPDGTVRLVRSALRAFEQEVGSHRRGRCGARTHAPLLPISEVPVVARERR